MITWRKLLRQKVTEQQEEQKKPGKVIKWLVYHLQKYDGVLTIRQKSLLLGFFCLTGSVYFIHLIVQAYSGKSGLIKVGNKTVIVPLAGYKEDNKSLGWLVEYNHYLDSLKHDSSGIRIYQKMRSQRPGLIDTIEMAGRLINDKN